MREAIRNVPIHTEGVVSHFTMRPVATSLSTVGTFGSLEVTDHSVTNGRFVEVASGPPGVVGFAS